MASRPINLLYVIYALNNGGAETLAIRLAEQLDRKRFNPIVCSLSDEGDLREVLEIKKISYITLGKREGKDFSIIRKLRKVIKECNIDLIHTHNQGPLLYSTLASLFCKKWKVVHTEHINMGQEFSYSVKHQLYNRFLYRRTDGFVSIANHLTEGFVREFAALKHRVVTIRNSVDFSQLQSGFQSDLRQELNLSSEARFLGNISALRQQKDHATLIRAMRMVCDNLDDTYLLIAGTGECEDDLKALAKELKLPDKIIFLGFRNDIANLLQQFDLFILSSLYEGLPLCLLEAMGAGCPVVATDVVGTNELVQPEQTGLLAQPKNPEQLAQIILRLLGDHSLQNKLRTNALSALQTEFSYQKMMAKYQKYYSELLNK